MPKAVFFGSGLSHLASGTALSGLLKVSFLGLALEGTGSLLTKLGVSPKLARTLVAGGKIAAGIGMLATGNPLGLAMSLGLAGSGTSELLSLHTSLPPVLTQMIGIGASGLAGFAGGLIDAGSLAGALSGLRATLPHLALDLASSGLAAAGSALGLDWRITALIGLPVRAAVGGLVSRIGSSQGIFNSIKDSLFSSETLGGLVSVGASIGLDAIGAPPVLQSFVPGILGQLTASATGSTGGGGGPGDPSAQQQGESLFKKITDGIVKFGKGIVSIGQQVVSFGQKVFEGGVSLIRQGLAKAADLFSNLFDRKTIENLSSGGQTTIEQRILTSGNFLQDGDIFSWTTEFGGQTFHIEHLGGGQYLVQEGNQTKTFMDILMDDFGNFGGANITIADVLSDGIVSRQYYDSFGLEKVEFSRDNDILMEIAPYDDVTRLSLDERSLTGQFKSNLLGFDYRIRDGQIEDYLFDPFKTFGVETSSVTPKFNLANLTSPEQLVFSMFHDAVTNQPGSEILAGTVDAAKDLIQRRITDLDKAAQILDFIDVQGVVPRIELVAQTEKQTLEFGSFRLTRETSRSAFYGNLDSDVTIKISLETGTVESFSVKGQVPFSTLSGPVIDGVVLSDIYANMAGSPLLDSATASIGISTGTSNFSNSIETSRNLLTDTLSIKFKNTIGIGAQDAHTNTITIEGNQNDIAFATALAGGGILALNAFGAWRLAPVLQTVLPALLAAFAQDDDQT